MKILKSGALTAFSALALMASHGVHAAPKGRSLSAMSKLFAHKTLAFAKTHPKTSFTLGALGLGALGATGVFLSVNAALRNKQERAEKTKELVNAMKDINLKGQFESISHSAEALKDAIEKGGSLNENALGQLSDAIKELNWIAGNNLCTCGNLERCITLLKGAMEEGVIQENVRSLITNLTNLMRKVLLSEMQDVKTALGRNQHLKSLINDFKALEGAIIDSQNLNSGDIKNLSDATRGLRRAEEDDLAWENLAGMVFWLERVNSEALQQPKNYLCAAINKIKEQLKKKKLERR